MSKKGIFIGIVLIIFILFTGYFLFVGESVNVYMDGENVTSQIIVSPFAGVDTNEVNKEICDYIIPRSWNINVSYIKRWRYCNSQKN